MLIEIILILIASILLISSFVLPQKIVKEESFNPTGDSEIRKQIQHELDNMHAELETIVSDLNESMEAETKRKLEYLANEKIMAIHEYSDQVMDSIHKNHGEVMFLYGMLNDKENDIKQLLEQLSDFKASANNSIGNEKKIVGVNKQMNMSSQRDSLAVFSNEKNLESIDAEMEELGINLDSAFSFMEEGKSQKNEELEEVASAFSEKQDVEIKSRSATGSRSRRVKPLGTETRTRKSKDAEGIDNQRILQLFDQGNTTKEIAKKLKVGVGEVKLIVDLNRGEKV